MTSLRVRRRLRRLWPRHSGECNVDAEFTAFGFHKVEFCLGICRECVDCNDTRKTIYVFDISNMLEQIRKTFFPVLPGFRCSDRLSERRRYISRARTVATMTTAEGVRPAIRHLISRNYIEVSWFDTIKLWIICFSAIIGSAGSLSSSIT